MKYLGLLFITLFIISCNKQNQLPTFTCHVNGVEWNSSSVSVGRNHDTNLLIVQVKDDTLNLILKIEAEGVNEYDLSSSSNHKAYVIINKPAYNSAFSSTNALSNGSFTISEISRFKKKMNGSFSFNAFDDNDNKISFTNGKFSGYTYFK